MRVSRFSLHIREAKIFENIVQDDRMVKFVRINLRVRFLGAICEILISLEFLGIQYDNNN